MKTHNLVQMLELTVNRFPDRIACTWKENGKIYSITYQKLWNQIRDFAFGLERLGIRPGSKVALFSHNHPRWIISDFAILSLGAVTVPIDPFVSPDQLKTILERTEIETIIVGDSNLMTQFLQFSQNIRHIILLKKKPDDQHKALQFETVIQMGQTVALEELDWAYPAIQPVELATIVYDSPSKGIMLSHVNLLSSIESALLSTPISRHDQVLSHLPFSSIFSRCLGLYLPLYQGASIMIKESLEAHSLHLFLKELKPTILIGPSSLFETLYIHIKQKRNSKLLRLLFPYASQIATQTHHYVQKGWNWVIPSHLRLRHALAHSFIFSILQREFGGSLRFMISDHPLKSSLSYFFQQIGIPIIESYRLAACSIGISIQRIPDLKPGTAGKPFPGMEIRTLTDGEILVKSNSVMMGYYQDDEATSKVLINGWLHTGIIGELDEEGWLHIKGIKSS